MPEVSDPVQISFILKSDRRPFPQTSTTVSAVSCAGIVLDGFCREVTSSVTELKAGGPGRWTLAGEIRTRARRLAHSPARPQTLPQ